MTLEDDVWTTVASEARASLKIQRSEFTGIIFPCQTEDSFQSRLAGLQKEFYDATHHCWAWRLFGGGEIVSRSSDAGEPGGTAGRPILGALESAGLTDAGLVVVRYYGGVKLGTGGLGRAYRDAARGAIAVSSPVEKYLYEELLVRIPFSQISIPYRLVDPPHVTLAGEEYGEVNLFTFSVRRSRLAQLEAELVRQRFEIVR